MKVVTSTFENHAVDVEDKSLLSKKSIEGSVSGAAAKEGKMDYKYSSNVTPFRETKSNMENVVAEESESDGSYNFSEDAYDDECEKSLSEDGSESNLECPPTDTEIEEMIDEFLLLESKAADAQETLEVESLLRVEREVSLELSQSLTGMDLEVAVENEMKVFREQWEHTLDHLEDKIAVLLEQLDYAGIELPTLYKWIEKQAPEGCSTEAWKKRIHWAGFQPTTEVTDSVNEAECDLQACRPVRRHRGKLLEEGASGFLVKKLAIEADSTDRVENTGDKDWGIVDNFIGTEGDIQKSNNFGSKQWAVVYLASTPEQAATMGLNLPGVNEVEEIDDIENCPRNPIYAAAVANEKECGLTEEQKSKFRKVKEEEDVRRARKMHRRFKHRRNESQKKMYCKGNDDMQNTTAESISKNETNNPKSLSQAQWKVKSGIEDICNNGAVKKKHNQQTVNKSLQESQRAADDHKIANEVNWEISRDKLPSSLMLLFENQSQPKPNILKRSCESEDLDLHIKRMRTVIIDSDDETDVKENGVRDSHYCQLETVTKTAAVTHEVVDLEMISDDEVPPYKDVSVGAHKHPKEFKCTACGKLLKASGVKQHPLFEVIICKDCKNCYDRRPLHRDPDGSESCCCWCGQGGDVICCDFCEKVVCEKCIERNIGAEKLTDIINYKWHCFCCVRDPLNFLIEDYNQAAKIASCGASDSDSMSSDEKLLTSDSSKKQKGRRTRRIIDDAELEEETKKKIAIEKERQDHLKMLQQQSEQWSKGSTSLHGDKAWLTDNEILGNPAEGYIVNVAREHNEKEVRVSPMISYILKPHQVAGIRFMWENCIQSVNKIKSGDKGLGCILAHCMGLGKTLQAITFLYTIMRSVDLGLKTALIVTPVNVLHNWRQEFLKWQPWDLNPLPVFMLEDVSRESMKRAKLLTNWRKKGGVLLIGYAAFRNLSLGKYVRDKAIADDICEALQSGPDILICDEAHMIKNTKADITQALKQVKTQRRIALTGSPLQNNLMEYYCMVDFVREGFLGTKHEFRNRFQNPIENGQHANSTADDVKIMNQRSHVLYEQLKGFVQRMGMNVMKDELPPKFVYVISVKLSSLQRKLYVRFLEYHGFTKNDKILSAKGPQRKCFFSAYHSLSKIWNHPGLLQIAKEDRDCQQADDTIENFLVEGSFSDDDMDRDFNGDKSRDKMECAGKIADNESLEEVFIQSSNWWEDIVPEKAYANIDYSGKMVLLLDLLLMSSERGDKALVFSQSLGTLDLIESFLAKLPRHGKKDKCWRQGKEWYRLDGSTTGAQRQKLVEQFNDPLNTKAQCIIISTRAGSLGINLPAANRVIIVDGSWNPTHDLQALFRVWRFGQKKDVYVYRLVAHGTMEEKIYKRQVTKEGLAARVVDQQQVHRTMTKEEILHLFKLEDNDSTAHHYEGSKEPMTNQVENTEGIPHDGYENLAVNPLGSLPTDAAFMKRILEKHCSSWIFNYHEHETLLQENKDERLSKEERDMALENFKKFVESEKHKHSVENCVDWIEVTNRSVEQNANNGEFSSVQTAEKITSNHALYQNSDSFDTTLAQSTTQKYNNRAHPDEHNLCVAETVVVRNTSQKCSNMAHATLLLRNNVKTNYTIACTDCGKEIGWENLVKGVRR
ncbi:protein CHROMATIN REMODELING 20 isoform X1 [Cryptomeria japonica]|uniref:protein CHROMATIN REMODELING 20 isoform X1 n=2 Tax=Cryptomeria japonica TaxID=3369 RepID=UPI0025AD69A7|nr:protein CHROMATIN REMODELING 20 isoform X1 [Cryptomeria japonica]